jgi:hypothetical protein
MAAGDVLSGQRPATTRRFRKRPLGWTAPQAAEIAGIPVRTVQYWRTSRMFVSAFPLGTEEGFRPGELYALGDAIGLRFLRDLLALKVNRELATRLARVVQVISPGPDGDFWAYRRIAVKDPPWWWFFPVAEDLAEEWPDEDLLRFWDESMLATQGLLTGAREDRPIPECQDDPCAYWYPVSAVAAELVSSADSWRRRHRVSVRDWPVWM